MQDYDFRHTNGNYHNDRRNRFGFSDHGHGAEYVTTKIEKSVHSVEKSVHSAFDRRSPLRLASMELDENHKVHHKEHNKAAPKAEEEAKPKFKIAKWKHHDLGNKLGHKHAGKADLEKKEPLPPPGMINTGGWARPNRAMWASPPTGSSASEPEYNIEDALEYLKEAGGQTGHSGSWSRSSAKPRSGFSHMPSDVRETLDHMREPVGVGATDSSGYRFSVVVPVRKYRDME